ncbi:MAG: YlbF family regulator [Peptococcaceae bacterium]|jgi:cell fate (sporulation/competence/biofilm development) regulator YlbF (YheA/YmcA/DUF963 family)|nr:YlbF family regulator [Peptococcaceae bacterium]MDH7525564.1 YlbF family regulator [Peptococcaceae bacterium]
MIYDKAHELARAIKFSPEYRQFKEAKEKVSQNPENIKILQDFHMKQLEIQTMQVMGKEIPPEKMQEYEKMGELLSYHPSVREFLQAEFRLAQVMADIQKILAEAVELELPKVDQQK